MRIAEFQAERDIIAGTPSRRGGMPASGGLPRANPQMFASMGQQIAQLGRMIIEAGHARRELEEQRLRAKDESEALSLYTGFARDADMSLSHLRATTSPQSFPAFTETAQQHLDTLLHTYTSRASNERVRDLFIKKSASFYLEQLIGARRHQDKLEVDYHTGALTGYLAEQRRQIAQAQDEHSARLILHQTLGEIAAKTSLIGAERAAKLIEEFRASEGLYLAQMSISRNPMEFLPAAEGGGDGFKRYLDLIEGTRLDDLLKTARAEAERQRRARIEAHERYEREAEQARRQQVTRQVTEWLARLDAGESPDVIQRELDARGPLGTGVIIGDDYERVRRALKNITTEGDKEAFDRYALEIERDPDSVSTKTILSSSRLTPGQKRQLIELHDRKRRGMDLSDNPVYKHGLQFVERSLGGTPTNILTQALRMQGTYNVEQDRLRERAILDYRFALRRRYKDERALLDDPDALKRVTDIAQDIVERYIKTYPHIFSTGLTPGPQPQQQQQQQKQPQPQTTPPAQAPRVPPATKLFNPFTPPKE